MSHPAAMVAVAACVLFLVVIGIVSNVDWMSLLFGVLVVVSDNSEAIVVTFIGGRCCCCGTIDEVEL